MTPQRITLVTLGVKDLPRARRFYKALGWEESARSQEDIAFFQLNSMALGLFGLSALADDQQRPVADLGTGAMTLAQNLGSPAEVDTAFAKALACGATEIKPPQEVFWGGYSGYYADPDGHVWEIAHNPFWPLGTDGSLTLPNEPVSADD